MNTVLKVSAKAAGNTLEFASAKPLDNQKPHLVAMFIYCYDKVGVPLDVTIECDDAELKTKFCEKVTAQRWELDRVYGQCDVITTL